MDFFPVITVENQKINQKRSGMDRPGNEVKVARLGKDGDRHSSLRPEAAQLLGWGRGWQVPAIMDLRTESLL